MSGYAGNRSMKIYRIMVRRGIVIPDYEEVMYELKEDPAEEQASPAEQQGSGAPEAVGDMSPPADESNEFGEQPGNPPDNQPPDTDETQATVP
jgi:monofunctional biosynthetic peptidoglycan transglycosylase